MIHALYRATLAAAGMKKGSVPKQLKVPRPEVPQTAATTALPSEDDVLGFFAGLTPASSAS